ncbi:MAG: DegT/DnrJ/EryC1/StrS family aminotransferase [Planctomycetota bacterium]|jgi:dTDP-4-amino-4,6-dideoxygalactose transaminase
MSDAIHLVDIHAQNAEIRAEIDEALKEVIDFGAFVLGPMAASFEDEFAQYLGVKHAVACNSGTDALMLACDVVRETAGTGQIITTPFTFFATAEAIIQAGHEVVFADIDADTFNLDPDAVAAALKPETVAVMPVHLYGQCADVGSIMAAAPETMIIEDAAQAVGASRNRCAAGGLGHIAGFSFYPTKNLAAMGDAGAITTDDENLAELARSFRAHGEQKAVGARTYHYERIGRNSRMDGFQAAVLRLKLKKLPEWHEKRIANARFYDEWLEDIDGITPPPAPKHGRHVYHQYAPRAERRDALVAHLQESGIHTRVFYPEPLHLAPALAELGCKEGQFPEAERASREVLSLPVHPHLSEDDRERVVEQIRVFYRG